MAWTWIILILQRHDETRTSSEHPSWAQVLWTMSLLHDLPLLYARMPFAREGLRFICTACNCTPYPVPCLKWHLKDRIPITLCSLGGWRLWSSTFSYFLVSWVQSSPQWQNLFALVHVKNTVISKVRERKREWFLWQTIEQCFRNVEWEGLKGKWVGREWTVPGSSKSVLPEPKAYGRGQSPQLSLFLGPEDNLSLFLCGVYNIC